MLRRLRDLGLLVQHSHASATYYTPTRRLLHPEGEVRKVIEGGIPPDGLPTMLAEAIRNLGQVRRGRCSRSSSNSAASGHIRPMNSRCSSGEPKSGCSGVISPLLRAEIIEYTIPGKLRHPMQAYRTKK